MSLKTFLMNFVVALIMWLDSFLGELTMLAWRWTNHKPAAWRIFTRATASGLWYAQTTKRAPIHDKRCHPTGRETTPSDGHLISTYGVFSPCEAEDASQKVHLKPFLLNYFCCRRIRHTYRAVWNVLLINYQSSTSWTMPKWTAALWNNPEISDDTTLSERHRNLTTPLKFGGVYLPVYRPFPHHPGGRAVQRVFF